MSLYGHASVLDETNGVDLNALVEAYCYDDLHKMSSDKIHEFCESEQAQALLERSVLKKPTLMRLSREDDEKRRIKLACYQLAKDAKDPNWDKMLKYRALWKKYRGLIFKKYATRATRIARIAQKQYIKNARTEAPKATDNAR